MVPAATRRVCGPPHGPQRSAVFEFVRRSQGKPEERCGRYSSSRCCAGEGAPDPRARCRRGNRRAGATRPRRGRPPLPHAAARSSGFAGGAWLASWAGTSTTTMTTRSGVYARSTCLLGARACRRPRTRAGLRWWCIAPRSRVRLWSAQDAVDRCHARRRGDVSVHPPDATRALPPRDRVSPDMRACRI